MATTTPIAVGELVGTDWLNSCALAWWRDTTLVDIVSSVAETDLLGSSPGISIPANTLGTQRMLRITVLADLLNNTGVNGDGVIFKLYYGGTAVTSTQLSSSPAGVIRQAVIAVFHIAAEGATNAQAVIGEAHAVGISVMQPLPAANATKGWTDLATDDTVAQNLRLTATLNANNASLEFRKRAVIVEVV